MVTDTEVVMVTDMEVDMDMDMEADTEADTEADMVKMILRKNHN